MQTRRRGGQVLSSEFLRAHLLSLASLTETPHAAMAAVKGTITLQGLHESRSQADLDRQETSPVSTAEYVLLDRRSDSKTSARVRDQAVGSQSRVDFCLIASDIGVVGIRRV